MYHGMKNVGFDIYPVMETQPYCFIPWWIESSTFVFVENSKENSSSFLTEKWKKRMMNTGTTDFISKFIWTKLREWKRSENRMKEKQWNELKRIHKIFHFAKSFSFHWNEERWKDELIQWKRKKWKQKWISKWRDIIGRSFEKIRFKRMNIMILQRTLKRKP